jgi:ATP-dependent DNA helicase Rep
MSSPTASLDTLNPAQREAVLHTSGPCLVLAGAGSGKTRVITFKMAHLLKLGLQPSQVAAITFTNKAADEMRERAKTLVGGKAGRELVVSTFHALGVRMLRESGHALGLKPNFSILDSDDVLGLVKEAGGTTDAALAKRWQWAISGFKNAGLNPEAALAQAGSDDERIAAQVMKRYQERLSAFQAVDFDDLIGLPLQLLSTQAAVREQWQQRFRHVLVDEYQDTNAVQYELLKLLVGERARFTAVGDDDQSIYGWRGATLDNLRRLPHDFADLKVIKLEQNYRSTSAILRAANAVISGNPKLFEKTLFSALGEGEPVRVSEADSEEHEAERTVARIQALRGSSEFNAWKHFAVLYRANHQAKPFEQALRKASIPYKVSGGQSFFDKAEIRDLCSWLRLLVNQDDDPAFIRAITTPKRGIGHTTLASLGELAGRLKKSLFEAVHSPMLQAAVNARAAAGLHEFASFVNELEYQARHAVGSEAARSVMMGLLKSIGYEQHLFDTADSPPQATTRWANALELVDWIARRCGGEVVDGELQPGQSLLQCAQTISLITSLADKGDENVVTLSTLHAAKGLEWPHVTLAGVNEGLLPFSRDAEEGPPLPPTAVQEERRLMYVGITRAQRNLTVSVLRRRKRGRDLVAAKPSRFVAEMKLGESDPAASDPRAALKALREKMKADIARREAEAPTHP